LIPLPPNRRRLYKATTNSSTLKVTIPANLAKLLDLHERDEVDFDFDRLAGVKTLLITKAEEMGKGV